MKQSDIKTIAIVVGIAGLLYFLSNKAPAASPNPSANADMGGENFGANNPNTWD
jgi:hypothetical protein